MADQLTLTPDGKDYLDPESGKTFDRVTSITDILPKPALVPWAEGVGRKAILAAWREGIPLDDQPEWIKENGLDCDSAKTSGGDRGSALHEVFVRLGRGEDAAPSTAYEFMPYVQSLTAFFNDYLPSVQESEVVVVNRELGYAGRFDAILKTGAHPPRRRHEHVEHQLGLWDLKTNAQGRAYKPAHPAQVTLYEMARRSMGLEPTDYQAVLAVGPAKDGKPNFSVTINTLPESFGEALVNLYREMEAAKG